MQTGHPRRLTNQIPYRPSHGWKIESFVVVNVNKEKHAALPPDEAARLRAVNRYHILDTPADGAFDCVAELAARIFKVPIALISIVDEDRVWFKSHHGINISEIDREPELCASAILRDAPTIVTDAKVDPRTLSNSLVAGSFGLRFYAAAPLHTADGFNLGTLCIIDKEPRTLTEAEVKTLQSMATIVMDQLELRLSARRQDDSESALRAKMQDIIAERTAQLSRLSQELIRNSEEERAKLAGELHEVLVHQGYAKRETHQFDVRIDHGVSARSQIVRSEAPTRGRPRPKENWRL
ncbi:MAG: GAF domain-containing protein [Candidatus Eremiobacteraeota bacterium]|nr:GAF domain-containing protein [Candidatus Eremiobacteraeota bacterium]